MEKETTAIPVLNYRKGFKDGIPIGLGYFPGAVAYGITAMSLLLSFGFVQILNASMFSISSQAAILNLIKNGASAFAIYLSSMLIMNFRHILYSLSLSQKLDKNMTLWQKIIYGFFNTDEHFIIAMRQKSNVNFSYLMGMATASYSGQIIGAIAGFLFSSILPPSVKFALGITIYALFTALIVPPMKKSKSIIAVVLIAASISVLIEVIPGVKPLFGQGKALIVCVILTGVIGALLFPVKEEKEETTNGGK